MLRGSKIQAKKVSTENNKIDGYVTDETQINDGFELIWFWVIAVIESTKDKEILSVNISEERKMFVVVAEQFISNVIKEYGKHPVSIDCGLELS